MSEEATIARAAGAPALTITQQEGFAVIQMGDHEVTVVPQRHARLRHKLSDKDFQAILTADYGRESYRVLGILIPDLHEKMTLWEYEGFASEEAMNTDDYDEDRDRCPTTAQIVNAFKVALSVSGAGEMGKIIDLIQTGVKVQEMAPTPPTPMPSSPDSHGENGASASTSTGAPNPT